MPKFPFIVYSWINFILHFIDNMINFKKIKTVTENVDIQQ